MPYRTTLVSLHCRFPRSAPPSADISFLWLHHPCSMRVPHFYKVGPVSRLALPSLLSTALQAITATVSQSERWLDFYFNVPWHCCPCHGELGLPWRPWPREREKTRESATNIVSYYAALTSGDIRVCARATIEWLSERQISALYEHLRTVNVDEEVGLSL